MLAQVPACPPRGWSRRAAIAALILACGSATLGAADSVADLSASTKKGGQRKVKVVLEVTGDLKLNGEGTNVVRVPVRVRGQLDYAERFLQRPARGSGRVRAVRHYDSAEATITYRGEAVTSRLREDRHLIGVSAEVAERQSLFSPLGPLTREELELIDVPGSSALVDQLLPGRRLEPGAKWKLTGDSLAPLLGLDRLTGHSIQCELNRIEGGLAIVYLTGTVNGAVGGVSSDVRLVAKYAFDLRSECITWLAMSLKEKRAIGHAQPGLDVTARLRMAVTPVSTIPVLQDQVLADLQLEDSPAVRLLDFRSPTGGFRLLLDRRWHAMIDRNDVTVLRLVDHGELVAQCNLSTLPRLTASEQFSMIEFQADIKRVLDESFGEFVTASESLTDHEVHVLRVVVSGTVSELPIQWVYYHLNNKQGRRASCVFTLEQDLVESFGAMDQTLISSFQFTPPQPTTPAATAQDDPSRTAQRPPSDPTPASRPR